VWRLAERVRVTGAVFGRRVDVAVEPTPLEKALLRCLCIPQRGFGEAVERWLCAYESLDGSPRLRGTALICVFGSVARGGADVDSDIDILVVTDREAPPGPWGEDYPLRGGAEGLKVVSPLFLSMEEFERNMRLDGNVRRAVREGILVWERGTD
jgi:predicted nucleotidyltransferase